MTRHDGETRIGPEHRMIKEPVPLQTQPEGHLLGESCIGGHVLQLVLPSVLVSPYSLLLDFSFPVPGDTAGVSSPTGETAIVAVLSPYGLVSPRGLR